MTHDWGWKITELGQGPDRYFIARFDPSSVENLRVFVRQHLPEQYVPNTAGHGVSPRSSERRRVYEAYVDRHLFEKLERRRWWRPPENCYIHATIEVCDNELVIENILSDGYGETPMLVALARSPELVWQEWRLGYSGYSSEDVASGRSAGELLEYLGLSES